MVATVKKTQTDRYLRSILAMLDWTGLITYSGTVGCRTMQWFGWVDSRWGWVGWSDWMQRELPFKVKFNLVWVELPWKYVCHGVHRLQQAGLPTASSSIFLLQTLCVFIYAFIIWHFYTGCICGTSLRITVRTVLSLQSLVPSSSWTGRY